MAKEGYSLCLVCGTVSVVNSAACMYVLVTYDARWEEEVFHNCLEVELKLMTEQRSN